MSSLGWIPTLVLARNDETFEFGVPLAWAGQYLPVGLLGNVFPAFLDNRINIKEQVQLMILYLRFTIGVANMLNRLLVAFRECPERSVFGNRQFFRWVDLRVSCGVGREHVAVRVICQGAPLDVSYDSVAFGHGGHLGSQVIIAPAGLANATEGQVFFAEGLSKRDGDLGKC